MDVNTTYMESLRNITGILLVKNENLVQMIEKWVMDDLGPRFTRYIWISIGGCSLKIVGNVCEGL